MAVVAGDVTMEWSVARLAGGAAARGILGGAAALADLIRAATPGARVLGVAGPPGPLPPGDPRVSHAWTIWTPPTGEPATDGSSGWRLEEDLGVEIAAPDGSGASGESEDDPGGADLVVLHDAALGFRDRPDLWPRVLRDRRRRPWILLATTGPVVEGELWARLLEDRADRLIVVVPVRELRRNQARISRDISWERTAQDLAWELVYNPRLNEISRAARVVVPIGLAGALLLARGRDGGPRARLMFDPRGTEEPGGPRGADHCLVAGIARRILVSGDGSDVEPGVQAGMAAARRLQQVGHRWDAETGIALPLEEVTAALESDARPMAVVDVRDPTARPAASGGGPETRRRWTIVEDLHRERIDALAPRVATEGLDRALPDVPVGHFGALVTVDRGEIESFRGIGGLILEHVRQRASRPLSVAVFGAPGSGKSFGVTQVARSLLPGRIETLTFNLSQFSGPGDLRDALHQVRDRALAGRIPLVFWDEFDTGDLVWLRHFLSPMQDGTFQEGQVVHPIGGGIFVFAGGTSATLRGFGAGLGEATFRAAKGPDFVSRLKGHVDVLGPNPRMDGAEDGFWPLRRAILLRAMLSRSHPDLFRDGSLRVDPGVLRAFLWTRTYRHGARSMESILATSRLHGSTRFDRSSLPPESVLDLHVDALDFLSRVQALDLEGEVLERLAEANHEVYRAGLAARGESTPSARLDYDRLSENEREQNRRAVRDIAGKLAAAGYVMIPARGDEPPFELPGPALERLAEMEHDRWLRDKLAGGWRWSAETDKPARRHAALLLWGGSDRHGSSPGFTPEELAALGPEPLGEGEKEKDRDLVRGIPRVLARAGFAIRPVAPDG